MKRLVALALTGMALTAVNTAFAQGHVAIWAYYVSPYNQVLWDASVPTVGGTAVLGDGVTLSFWIASGLDQAEGTLTQAVLDLNVAGDNTPFTIDTIPGFPDGQVLVTSAIGDYTVQIRASGTTPYGDIVESTSRSLLYNVTTASTANPAELAPISPGLTVYTIVPEPTTFALAGLGAAALLIFRRRD